MLDFQPLTLDMKDMIDSYTFKYGENSCQHSFVSSFCLNSKYGDMFCESENFLFTLRSKRCTDKERVYLFPHGNFEDTDGIKKSLQKIFDDAHEKNCRVKFETLTERAKNIVIELFPGKFLIEGSRDYSEYIHKAERLITFSGSGFAKSRTNIHRFFRDYEGRYKIEKIIPKYFTEIRKFQAEWLAAKNSIDSDPVHQAQLNFENGEINTALENFYALGLDGIVLFIDEKLSGYVFGVPVSRECFDEIINKGSRNIPNISRVLVNEFAKHCCREYEYINREEDLGVKGLRHIKVDLKPDFMIDKFILTEAAG